MLLGESPGDHEFLDFEEVIAYKLQGNGSSYLETQASAYLSQYIAQANVNGPFKLAIFIHRIFSPHFMLFCIQHKTF